MTVKFQLHELQRKIKSYRIEKSITQKEMTSLTGLSVRSIQRFENGYDISLENFLKILQALELSDMLGESIPDVDNRPSAYVDKQLNRTKKRAHKTTNASKIEFKWGDEK